MNQTCLANYIQSIFRLEKITATKTITIIHKFKRNTVGERNTSRNTGVGERKTHGLAM